MKRRVCFGLLGARKHSNNVGIMATPTEDTKEALKECIKRDSDQSGEDSSGDSDLSPLEWDEQDTFGESAFDKYDSEWLPAPSAHAGKRARLEQDTSNSSSGEESPSPKPSKRGRPSKRGTWGRARGRARGRGSTRGRQVGSSTEACWKGIDDPDITPPQPTFKPARSTGPQLIMNQNYTALQLLMLFISDSVLQTIVTNTNVFGAAYRSTPTCPWTDITMEDMFSFIAIVIYMGVVKCSSHLDYWRVGKLYDLPFPKQVMTGKKFLRMCRSIHLSSIAAEAENEKKKGTAAYDRLCKIKPMYDQIREACRRNYHPRQEISINERMVASKARMSLKQYLKNKPVRWGYKLFVLADSRNGYTWDFVVYEGKSLRNIGKGVGYETVMGLVNTPLLGTGYKLFVDNFYTSPALFVDLLEKKIWACGTIPTHRLGYPETTDNTLDRKGPHDSIRWFRKDALLFVQWKDFRDVSLCSTLHTAYSGDTVKRRTRCADGQWVIRDVPVPAAVKEFNQFMGGVDLSDAQIGYSKVLHKTQKWYKTFFYHFLDIAVVNAFLLHKDIAARKAIIPMTQKAFREALAEQLAELGSTSTARPGLPPASERAHHRPIHIGGDSTTGRKRCKLCQLKTPVKCSSCGVPLCFVPGRDCYNQWHEE